MVNKEKTLNFLESAYDEYLRYLSELASAGDASIYMLDLFFIANVQRSQYLIDGFALLVRNKNFFCAAPLIRMHLDNVLHMYAMFLHQEADAVATGLMKGKKRLKDYKDKDGKSLTDSYLVKKFFEDAENAEFLPLKDVYGETSMFVHFSEKHIQSLFEPSNFKDNEVEFRLLGKTFDIPEKEEVEAINAMVMITRAQLKYLIGWIHTKNL